MKGSSDTPGSHCSFFPGRGMLLYHTEKPGVTDGEVESSDGQRHVLRRAK